MIVRVLVSRGALDVQKVKFCEKNSQMQCITLSILVSCSFPGSIFNLSQLFVSGKHVQLFVSGKQGILLKFECLKGDRAPWDPYSHYPPYFQMVDNIEYR